MSNLTPFFVSNLINLTGKSKFWISAIFLSLFLLAYFKFKSWEEERHLSVIPYGLNVSRILYVKEDSWGFGPGGNETGVVVYELPENIARKIEKDGIAYFAKLPQKLRKWGEWRGYYDRWENTPIPFSGAWSEANENSPPDKGVPKIATYLNKYGFGISIDPVIEREIDGAISKQGSFFAYGRIGILIVIPEIRRVVYAYNG